jgi:hypothetical protein
MFAWSQLELLFLFQSLQSLQIQNVAEKGKLKDIRKKRHLAAFVFVPSIFGE